MAKINGFFETFLDKELYEKLHGRSKVIRVHCMVRFKETGGFSKPFPAIIDTGAHTSLLPKRIWESSSHNILGNHHIAGLVPGAKLDVNIGEVTAILTDIINTSNEYKFLCFLSPNDNIPLILGFKELLENFKIIINHKENIVSLEEKDWNN